MLIFSPLGRRFAYPLFALFLIFGMPVDADAAETYPDPEQITADISDPAKRTAVFYILTKVINNHGYSQEAANRYMAEQDKLDPPSAPNHQEFVKQWYPLTQDPNFVITVVRKYLPFLAGRVDGELREVQEQKDHAKWTEQARWGGNLIFWTMIAVPLLFLAWPWRVMGHKPKIADETAGPLRFPDALRRAKVFRKSYPLAFECGQIFDINEWTETTSSTSTTPGRSYTIGDTTYHEAGQTTTTYHSTKYHRYWLNRPDGKQIWTKFEDNVFIANKGNILSIVDAGGYIMFAYNHTTGNFIRQRWCWTRSNKYPYGWVWLATVLAVGLVTYYTLGSIGADVRDGQAVASSWQTGVEFTVLIYGAIALVYIAIVKWIVEVIRNFQFGWKYEKPVQKFFQEITPYLKSVYANRPPELPPVSRAG